MLEAQALRNHLKRKAFRNEATRQEHPVTPEKLLGSESGGSLDGVLQLPVCEMQVFGNTGDRESLGFGEFEQIVPGGAQETLPLTGNSERSWILSHLSVQESIITKRLNSVQEFTCHNMLT